MRVLAIDTATELPSLALSDGEGLLIERGGQGPFAHVERLLPELHALLKDAGIGVEALDCVCVVRGPGSFTGLRIGLATAQALALARGIPVVGVSSLWALALRHLGDSRPVAPLLDPRKGQIYRGLFDVSQDPIRAVEAERLEGVEGLLGRLPRPVLLCGDGAQRLRGEIEAAGGEGAGLYLAQREAVVAGGLARWTAQRLARGEALPAEGATPLYLRASEAEIKAGRDASSPPGVLTPPAT